jgi:uncharacterized membrane protein
MRTNRIEAFSDGVFSIAITLLVLEIHAPDDTKQLAHELGRLWPSYVAYVISFLLIGLIWANPHAMFDHIRRGDRVLLFLNTLLLMNVAFLPFATSIVATSLRSGASESTALVLYGGALVVGGVFFNAVWAWARRGHHLLDPALTPGEARTISRRFLVGPVMYVVGTLLALASPIAALCLFAGLILFYWLPVTAFRRTESDSSEAA